MSKLGTKLEAIQTGRKAPHPPFPPNLSELLQVDSYVNAPQLYAERFEYRLEVRMGYREFINSDGPPELLEKAKRVARRAILQMVFGEFRETLSALHVSIRREDWPQANEDIEALYQQMYGEDR